MPLLRNDSPLCQPLASLIVAGLELFNGRDRRWLCLVTTFALLSCQPVPRVSYYDGRAMGTHSSLQTIGPPLDRVPIQAELDRLEDTFSTWDANSELARFNRDTSGNPFPASISLRDAVAVAREVHHRSDGAFDPTIGPLVAGFGFGPSSLANSKAEPCFSSITLSAADGTLRKSRPDATLDLNALVEGFALDRVAATLSSQGQENFLWRSAVSS